MWCYDRNKQPKRATIARLMQKETHTHTQKKLNNKNKKTKQQEQKKKKTKTNKQKKKTKKKKQKKNNKKQKKTYKCHGNQRCEIELVQGFMPVLVTSNFDDNSIKMDELAWRPFSHYKYMEKFVDAQGQLTP